MEIFIDKFIAYLPKLGIALLIILIGFWLVKRLTKIIAAVMKKSKIDETLYGFTLSIISISLRIMLIITVASFLGVPMSSFLAVLGAASLAIGFALKDSLSNLAGGMLILYFRPFSIGDFIEVSGSIGTVVDIELLFTSFNTPENKRVYVPNGQVINSKVINYSKEKNRRMDIIISVSYGDDIDQVKHVITDVVESHQLVLNDPIPVIRVNKHAESSIDYILKVWCTKEDYWTVHHDLHEDIKKSFDKNGITIPYPQRDVHYFNQEVVN